MIDFIYGQYDMAKDRSQSISKVRVCDQDQDLVHDLKQKSSFYQARIQCVTMLKAHYYAVVTAQPTLNIGDLISG